MTPLGPADELRDVLLLRLEGPLMAFGGPMVDQHGPTRRLPGLSQTVGLLANALGYRHGEAGRLARLQERLSMASLAVAPGEELRDYQTVDLGQRHLAGTGWTTRGAPEERRGAAATAFGTHQRFRYLRADAVVLVAVSLADRDEPPAFADLEAALRDPARPLFVGRKSCLPSVPILLGRVRATRLVEALITGARLLADGWPRGPLPCEAEAEWPADEGPFANVPDRNERVTDRRDWSNQFHQGERVVRVARIPIAAGGAG